MLFRFFSYFSGMNIDSDIFKIQSNNVLPSRGRILISEPFLRDATFGRSVILLVDHTDEGSMGLVINKQLPLFLNDIIMEFKYLDEIPLYKGGPIATDTLFYLHTLSDIPGSISISKGLYLNGDFDEITELNVPYDSVVTGEDLYVFLPTNDEDIHTIESINRYSGTMLDIGMKMKTGIIVDFRQYDDLRSEPGEHIIPLFYGQHIKDGRVNHEASGKDYDWVIDEKPGLIQKNKDYIFCKRFTAKEERRRLQCGLYFANDFPEYENIGTQNKINFIERLNGEPLNKEELFGVFALFNSTLFDQYYRILNGSTQVNSTEVNSIPVPPLDVIRDIGRLLIESGQYTTEACDQILVQVAYA